MNATNGSGDGLGITTSPSADPTKATTQAGIGGVGVEGFLNDIVNKGRDNCLRWLLKDLFS